MRQRARRTARARAILGATLAFAAGATCVDAAADQTADPAPFWASGRSLMPAWGFFPNGAGYGGTRALDRAAAWSVGRTPGRLTWVAEFPLAGRYHVWVRAYGGYGRADVSIDEKPVNGGRGGPGGGRYTWRHKGVAQVSGGVHHVDVAAWGMFDAILFSADPSFDPGKNPLPTPVNDPVTRAPRRYRDDSHLRKAAGAAGFVVAPVPPDVEMLNDHVPAAGDAGGALGAWGCAGQYVAVPFVARALDSVEKLTVSATDLVGPTGLRLGPAEIDLRVVQLRARMDHLFVPSLKPVLGADLLVRDDRTGFPPKGRQGGFGGGKCATRIPAHESRAFVLTAHVPAGAAPGRYGGAVVCAAGDATGNEVRVPVAIDVLPLALRSVEGYYGIYHRAQSTRPDREHYVPPAQYLAELRDMVRHGLNTVTLYGGFDTLPMVREAGMTEPPCLMQWPGANAAGQVAAARRMGFADLHFYGVDEPNSPEQIDRCRKEAERRSARGLHMFTAINSRKAWEATEGLIDRPVYNLYVFGDRDNPAAMRARRRGFVPISYWTTTPGHPLWFRAMTGLYNRACGYLGSSPWAYRDHSDARAYDGAQAVHRMCYPDESGDPIPMPGWEAHREGIDDVRYLQALDRALDAARARLARPSPPPGLDRALARAAAVRAERFESIRGRWFQYLCPLRTSQLEQTRRAFADAACGLNALLE